MQRGEAKAIALRSQFATGYFGCAMMSMKLYVIFGDQEITPPPSIDPGLPDTTRFVVFLGMQGRVAEIMEEVGQLFIEVGTGALGRLVVRAPEAGGELSPHFFL